MSSYSFSSYSANLPFTVNGKKHITIDSSSKLYPLLLVFISDNCIEDKNSALSFDVDVLASRKKNSKKSAIKKSPYKRVTLKIGWGCFAFKIKDDQVLYAAHQKLGDVVGTNCSPEIKSLLTIFTDQSVEDLAQFMSDIVEASEGIVPGTFTCYTWHIRHQYWRTESHVTARPFESVVLPESTKSRLLADVEKFLSPRTAEFYSKNGIPYRRSYLFHGLPGTGKTSMVQALAGKFNRNVCFLMPTHPEMTDDSLREAINQIPDDSIVVFEDIDSLFAKDRSNKVSKSNLTFSGLLNSLDGIGNPNGQIYILTTNLRDQLDPALIRKGRVDLHIEFTYTTAEQMELMWRNFYPESSALAKTFSSNLIELLTKNEMQITTSTLQHFFITQMDATAEEALSQLHVVVDEVNFTKVEEEEAAKKAIEDEKAKEEAKKVTKKAAPTTEDV
eukprot:gene12018-16087_t